VAFLFSKSTIGSKMAAGFYPARSYPSIRIHVMVFSVHIIQP